MGATKAVVSCKKPRDYCLFLLDIAVWRSQLSHHAHDVGIVGAEPTTATKDINGKPFEISAERTALSNATMGERTSLTNAQINGEENHLNNAKEKYHYGRT